MLDPDPDEVSPEPSDECPLSRFLELITDLTCDALAAARELIDAGDSRYMVRSQVLDDLGPMGELTGPQRRALVDHVGRILDAYFSAIRGS